MPRRNQRPDRSRPTPEQPAAIEDLTTDDMARRLVEAGLAHPVILGPLADRQPRRSGR